MLSSGIRKIAKRHGMPIYKAIGYELFIRSYRKCLLRFFLKLLFNKKKPLGWIFLVGCYNSGTTVLKNSIAAHPDVVTPPVEGDVLTTHLSQFEDGGWPRGMLANSYLINQHRQNDTIDANELESDWRPWIKTNRYYLEKSISLSVRIKLLRKAFPGCKFVCITRDPQAVIEGIGKRSVPGQQAQTITGSSQYSDKFLLNQWAYIYNLILEDSNDNDTIFFSYEEFIASACDAVEELYRFLGLSNVPISYENNTLKIADSKILIRPLNKKHESIKDPKIFLKENIAIISLLCSDEYHG